MTAAWGDVRVAWAEVPDHAGRRAVAWALLRGLLPPQARLSNPCPRCGGPHGPVRVAGAPFLASVSYAGGTAVAGVVPAAVASAFGIDAEPDRDAADLAGVLGPAASVRDWTRVEAALKADGRGLRVDPARVRVAEAAGGWSAVVPGAPAFSGRELPGPPGVLVGAAVRWTAR